MGRIGLSELIVILLVVLVLFGAKRLPELARALGDSIKAFKKGLHDNENDHS
jgi:sec-independent protein translocase protein TatA